ncbi:hypothetical protein [Bergeyella zoohelcum]|uniref:Uncharacterized protein n=1 Tax=Bergeyella zoohelcum TaxID=1015 RepID=A0A7Z9CHW3_9FLAO|nr:hypothetical protein [Bergeyella zoohelcum]VDH06024.1 Uncharacterised protein [Bergeyella zoohelcum]
MMKIEERHKQKCSSTAICQENNIKFILNNANGFIKVQLDGGVIPKGKEPKCCDFYFYKENEIEIFVELKGVDVTKSFNQLESSFNHFAQKFPKIHAFSIVKGSLPKTNTKLQKFETKMKKKNVDFKQKTNLLITEYVDDKKDIIIK